MTDKQVWSVNFWGSHPDKGEDNCHTGFDFDTEAEARECFSAYTGNPTALKAVRKKYVLEHGEKHWEWWITDLARSAPYVELVGFSRYSGATPDESSAGQEVGEVWCYLPSADDSDDYERMCQSEAAMQAGMAFGVDGYNDAMGFSLDHNEWD